MKLVGLILAGGKDERLGELTAGRALAAMPVASGYRAIDFTLSNMANSGITKVGVITQHNSRSLMNHLNNPKTWDLGTKKGGLYVFAPSITDENSFWHRGTADAIYQNLIFLKRSQEPYVVIGSGHHVYKMDYRNVLNFHIQKGADITVVSKKMPEEDLSRFGVMKLDKNKKIVEFEEKPLEPESDIASLGIYIMDRKLLIDILEKVVSEGRYDFVSEIIIRYRKKLNIYSYTFDGYWSGMGSVKEYHSTNMDFLNKQIREDILLKYPYINTRIKDEAPVKYNPGAKVNNCLISGGGIIEGNVEDSVMFSRVNVGQGAQIKNSVIMNNSYIGRNCIIENAILDKQVIVSDNKKIIGKPNNPIILKKGTVI